MSWVQRGSSCKVTRGDVNRELELYNQTLGCSYTGKPLMRVETVDTQLIMTSLRNSPARALFGAVGNKGDVVGIVLSGYWFLLKRSQVSSSLLLLKGWCKCSEIHRLRVLPQVHISAFLVLLSSSALSRSEPCSTCISRACLPPTPCFIVRVLV